MNINAKIKQEKLQDHNKSNTFNTLTWKYIETPFLEEHQKFSSPPTLLVIHHISLPPYQIGKQIDELNPISPVIGLFTGLLMTKELQEEAQIPHHPYIDKMVRNVRVSTHFYINQWGMIYQFVPLTHQAWHAGKSCWKGREKCNEYSIGIELEGSNIQSFSELQYQSLAGLTLYLQQELPLIEITGHENIAPCRKDDPGIFFDWRYYRFLIGNYS